jgi:hypothetical protein
MVALKIYIDENLFFKDDDTHVIIKTINVQDDICPDNEIL